MKRLANKVEPVLQNKHNWICVIKSSDGTSKEYYCDSEKVVKAIKAQMKPGDVIEIFAVKYNFVESFAK